jgi:hypothetical protein
VRRNRRSRRTERPGLVPRNQPCSAATPTGQRAQRAGGGYLRQLFWLPQRGARRYRSDAGPARTGLNLEARPAGSAAATQSARNAASTPQLRRTPSQRRTRRSIRLEATRGAASPVVDAAPHGSPATASERSPARPPVDGRTRSMDHSPPGCCPTGAGDHCGGAKGPAGWVAIGSLTGSGRADHPGWDGALCCCHAGCCHAGCDHPPDCAGAPGRPFA